MCEILYEIIKSTTCQGGTHGLFGSINPYLHQFDVFFLEVKRGEALLDSCFQYRHFVQILDLTHTGDYIIPKKGAIQMWGLLFCCSKSVNLAQAFDDIMQSFCHSYVGCSIHLAIDIWIIWDIETSTTD